jgi:hypothetical protein
MRRWPLLVMVLCSWLTPEAIAEAVAEALHPTVDLEYDDGTPPDYMPPHAGISDGGGD